MLTTPLFHAFLVRGWLYGTRSRTKLEDLGGTEGGDPYSVVSLARVYLKARAKLLLRGIT